VKVAVAVIPVAKAVTTVKEAVVANVAKVVTGAAMAAETEMALVVASVIFPENARKTVLNAVEDFSLVFHKCLVVRALV